MVQAETLRFRPGRSHKLAGLGSNDCLRRDRDRDNARIQGPSVAACCRLHPAARGVSRDQLPNNPRRMSLAFGKGGGVMLSMLIAVAAAAIPMTAPGPEGPLAGTFLNAGPKTP